MVRIHGGKGQKNRLSLFACACDGAWGGDNASSASAPAWVSGEVFVVALALALAADVSGNYSGKLARSAVTSVVLPALSCGNNGRCTGSLLKTSTSVAWWLWSRVILFTDLGAW